MKKLQSNKNNVPHNDTLYLHGLHIPFLPAVTSGIIISSGAGFISDNHGNELIKHELYFVAENGKKQHFHLNKEQFDAIVLKITPYVNAAADRWRNDDRIPVLYHLKSPLEEMGEELEREGAPIIPQSSKSSISR